MYDSIASKNLPASSSASFRSRKKFAASTTVTMESISAMSMSDCSGLLTAMSPSPSDSSITLLVEEVIVSVPLLLLLLLLSSSDRSYVNVSATAMGSDMPVLSMIKWSKTPFLARDATSLIIEHSSFTKNSRYTSSRWCGKLDYRNRSSRNVQQIQL